MINKSSNHTSVVKAVGLFAGALPLIGPLPGYAEQVDPGSSRTYVLEEITVTARKREESLSDVPIAISAVSGDAIQANGIQKMQDLAPTIPNLFVAEGVSLDSMQVRGVGSSINFGFEQTVGQVNDGFFYGRSRFSRLQFLDVERVEILKGPQGALIGKNTSAGAINITTKKPTEELKGYVKVEHQFEGSEGESVEAAVSGPLTDTLRGRVALRYDNNEGHVYNTAISEDMQEVDDWSGRVSMAWDASDSVDVSASWTHGEYDRTGINGQLSKCGGLMPQMLAANGVTGEDCTLNLRTTQVAPVNGVNDTDYSETELDTYGLTVNWKLENHTLTSLTGFGEYEYDEYIEGDRTPLEIFNGRFQEDYEQWSQELRLTSDLGGKLDYIVGFFYQHAEQLTDFRLGLNTEAAIMPVPIFPSVGTMIVTDQTTDSASLFAQATWHFNDEWAVTVGGRLTKEEKEADQVQSTTIINTTIPNPTHPIAQFHDIKADRDETNFSPMIDFQWTPNEETLVYGSIRRGYKAGGFDHQLQADQANALDGFEFEEEEVLAFELGAKLTLADGAAQLNIAAFRSEFEDMQVSWLENKPGQSLVNFRVGNAAEAVSQGVEVDLTWRVTENLTLFGAVGYLDATYEEYDGAACYNGQTEAQGCQTLPPAAGSPPGVPPVQFQSLADKELPYAADISGAVNMEYRWPLSNGMELIGFIEGTYTDDFSLVPNLDPNSRQESYWKYNGRITLADESGDWEVSLVGRNLDNELTANHGDELPAFLIGSYFQFVEPGRSFSLQARFRF